MRAVPIVLAVSSVAVVLAGCSKSHTRELDHDRIVVTSDAKLRTDTIGLGEFSEQATFVLVDARNTASEGAYVTLGGELAEASGAQVGELRAQSLWIPGGEVRTFALVDKERKPRPTAAAARIRVRGAQIPAGPPTANVGEVREIEDNGKLVLQGTLHNTAERQGTITVIATFYDAGGRPMTRPYSLMRIPGKTDSSVQFVGPEGSKHGMIFVGDMIY